MTGTFFPERMVKERLLSLADVRAGTRVLDLGCGTGTLAAMAARRGGQVVGIDADRAMLERARPKIEGLPVTLVQGLTTEVEFPAEAFDVVVSSLFFHHLPTEAKVTTLRRARAWLRPGGRLCIADWSRPRNPAMAVLFLGVRALDGFALTRDVLDDQVPLSLREAGFEDVLEVDTIATVAGNLSWWTAAAP
ncbi:MAG: class I SAM-dependent methyltransferase [Myxococcota bacterium]